MRSTNALAVLLLGLVACNDSEGGGSSASGSSGPSGPSGTSGPGATSGAGPVGSGGGDTTTATVGAGGEQGGVATLEVSIVAEERHDEHLGRARVELHASEPYWYVGDRPADIPAPVAVGTFENFTTTFDGLSPGRYWADTRWLAETGRLAYGVAVADVSDGANTVEIAWSYADAQPQAFGNYDAYEEFGILVFVSPDPEIDASQNGLSINLASNFIRVSGTANGRCGEAGDDQRSVTLVAPGSHSYEGSLIAPGNRYLRWRPRTVSVAADSCQFIDMGLHDCEGVGC